jgi:hypothetical protein
VRLIPTNAHAGGNRYARRDRIYMRPLSTPANVAIKVINSGGSGCNYGHNSGSVPLPLPLPGSALNFAAWNFAAAILNSRRYCGP